MTTEKYLRFTKEELLVQLKEIEEKKVNAIKNQNYELAADFRDEANLIRQQIENDEINHSS